MNTNCMFPLIEYAKNSNHFEWGKSHGEEFRQAISELAQIRKELMLAKNPKLLKNLDELALKQFYYSQKFAPDIAEEIEGIIVGSNLSKTDIVILNNYTDFRDIKLPEEGCSTIHVQNSNQILSGQTWDMHRSAKNYLSLIKIPAHKEHAPQLILSLVGCVGLMGVNTKNQLIGVNNINTDRAQTGIIWPVLVRKTIQQNTLKEMENELVNSFVTSGHNYLISSPEGGMHLEVTPVISECVGKLGLNESGSIFHTNHCLGPEIQKLEDKSSMSSTTFNRFNLLDKKSQQIASLNELKDLLMDHEEFPKSICSHFENGAQDPSFTCGGGVADLKKGEFYFWRGCMTHDADFLDYKFKIKDNDFVRIKE